MEIPDFCRRDGSDFFTLPDVCCNILIINVF